MLHQFVHDNFDRLILRKMPRFVCSQITFSVLWNKEFSLMMDVWTNYRKSFTSYYFFDKMLNWQWYLHFVQNDLILLLEESDVLDGRINCQQNIVEIGWIVRLLRSFSFTSLDNFFLGMLEKYKVYHNNRQKIEDNFKEGKFKGKFASYLWRLFTISRRIYSSSWFWPKF